MMGGVCTKLDLWYENQYVYNMRKTHCEQTLSSYFAP
jgi:hypothetical protein